MSNADGEHPSPTTCKFFTNEFQVKYFLPRVENTKDYGTSWVLRPAPVYIIYRILWIAFWIAHLIYDFVQLDQSGKESRETFLIYTTNWGYSFITLGTIFRLLSSVVYLCSQPDGRAAVVVYKIDCVLFSLYTPLSVYVTIIYWAFLHEGDIKYLGFIVHAINVVYTISDLIICSFPFRILQFWYSAIFGICFLIMTAIYWAVADRPVYDLVDWGESPGLATGVAIGTVVAAFVLHFLIFFIFWLRNLIRFKCNCDKNQEEPYTD